MQKKIVDIILTPGITNITRVVRVFAEVGGDLDQLSGVLNIPKEVLENELIVQETENTPKQKEPPRLYKEYVDCFFQGYLKATGIKWKFITRDFPYIKNLMKSVSLEQLVKIMDLYVKTKADIEAKRKVDFEMGNFAKNISPGYLVSKINFLIEKISSVQVQKVKDYTNTKL